MRCAMNGRIPPKQSEHKSMLTNNNKQTVAMLLAQNGITQIPKQWQHNSMLKDINKCTVAIYFAKQGIIPPQEWNHQPNILDNNNKTVQDYLKENGVQVPQQWQIIQEQPTYDYFDLAKNGIIPQKQQNFDSSTQDQFGNTVAMYLAQNNIIPPIQWQHDPEIKDNDGNTVCYYLWNNGTFVPNNWQDEQYKNPPKTKERLDFTEAMHQAWDQKIIPDKKYYHNPNITNGYGWTVAMGLASEGIIPPKQWEHQPDLQDKNGYTVASLLAGNSKIPPYQWEHDPYIKGYNGYTVAITLASEGMIPPKQWYHNPNVTNDDGWTVAMYLAFHKINIPVEWQHNPYMFEYTNGNTVAMYLASNGIIPSECWNHKPDIQNKYGKTVAMKLVNNKIIPPSQWNHKPELQDNEGNTVALYLSSNGIIPLQQWQHDPNIKNNYNKTVKDYLLENNIEIPNEWQIKTEQEKTNKQYKKTIIKNAKVEDVVDMIPSRDILEQQGDDVAIYTNLSDAQLQRLQEKFGKENISSVESEYKDFIKAKNLQPKISFAKFCRNEELKDDSQILFTIRSDPRDSQEERAKQFVKDIVKICYADNEQHTCKFFVRGWLFEPLIEMTTEGVEDKNGKITKQVKIYESQEPWNKNIPSRKSIICKVFVIKKDIPKYLEELQKFENKVTCTFHNPEKSNTQQENMQN